MSILKEFREFALRGNILELGTAVIIGAAFGKIVNSFVNDVLMPPLGLLIGNVDFKDLKFKLRDAQASIVENGIEVQAAMPEVTLNYGMFVQNIVDFTIVAFAIFMLIRVYNKAQKPATPTNAEEAAIPEDVRLLTEIRDLLKK
jgi:large conductance mechanosensitive channel